MKKLIASLLLIIFCYGFTYTTSKPEKKCCSIPANVYIKEKKYTEELNKNAEPAFHPLIFLAVRY